MRAAHFPSRAWLLGFSILLLASASAGEGGPLVLDPNRAEHRLPGIVEVLEDPSGALDIAAVAGSTAFSRVERPEPALGLSRSAWWLRFQVVDPEGGGPWRLELAWPLTDHATLYLPQADGGFREQRAGAAHEASPAVTTWRNPVFELPLEEGAVTSVYLRVQSDNSLLAPLRIWRAEDLVAHQRQEGLMLGVLYGMLGLAALVGLVFFGKLGEPAYLYYALLVASFGLSDAISEGMLGVVLWPSPFWSGRLLHMAGVVGVFAHLFFLRRFLATDEIAPRLDRIPVLSLPLIPILLLWPFVGDVQAFIRVAVGLVGVATMWTVAVEAVGLARGTRPARFFLLACVVLFASLIPYMLRAMGAASTSALTEFGIELGILLAATTLWVGLADQLKRSAADLRELNLSLEERIRERTAELEETSRELARANDAKRDFLATASHDLRQPLHALNLLIGALDARVREPAARELLGPVEQSAQGVGEMLDSLLDLSKLDAGVLEAEVDDVSLAPILSRLERELAESAARKGLSLRVDPTTQVVRTDPLLLQRILQNLLTNAVRYTDRGHVALRVEASAELVRVRVEDSGRGIPEDMRRRIFDSYARLDPGDEARREGLGLGLSIVRRLADLLGHGLEVEANPGGGSVFVLSLPPGASLPAPRAMAGFDGERILVVDPDPDTRAGLCDLLASWDCRPVPAESPGEVAGCLEREAGPPGAMVADAASSASALEALAALRRELSGVPAIVLSADSTRSVFDEARERGLVLLRKPVAPAKLRAALKHALEPGNRGS